MDLEQEHTENWNKKHKKAVRFQDFVMKTTVIRKGIVIQCYGSGYAQLKYGESVQGVEIKLDTQWSKTGRLSIEIAEKTDPNNPNWVPSGIYAPSNPWLYIQGNYKKFFVFSTKNLRFLHQSGSFEEHESFGTIKKFYLPVKLAEEIDLFDPDTWVSDDQ